MNHDQPVPTPGPPPASDLAALISRRLEELGDQRGPLSRRAAAARAAGLVSDFQLGNYLRGRVDPTAMSDRVARGIALAIDVPVGEVYAAARIPAPGSRWVLPECLDRLPEPKRRLVEDVARAML